ncbi:hypothetical protein [Streptacidiphilus sp. MAP12-20]|uniref:hypothetical protein n=1 Tax=Streptacidiphilus sp. MAP12-20 TaxID=3156299 RepID=UPI003518427C
MRWATAGCALLALLLGAVLTGAVTGAQSNWDVITRHQAPQVTDAGGLYQALTDLDAQAANQLMFGNDPKLTRNLATARQQYTQDRATADHDLQQATLDAAGNTEAQAALARVLDDMGSYQDLAGRALELNSHAHAAAGAPDPSALADYRQATDLMRQQLLPSAEQLLKANDGAFEQSYTSERAALGTAGTWLLLLGGGALIALVGLQVWLALRFRRIVNPALAAATLLTVALLGMAGSFLSGEGQDLKTARKDAFDSVVALTHARAVVYDSNAAESRYVLDAAQRPAYESAFQTDSDQILKLQGVSLSGYDSALAQSIAAYQQDRTQIHFTGFYGDEFRNITFGGERAAAEKTLLAYQAYQLDDRKIRALVSAGKLEEAIAYCTSLAPGGSNADFNAHDAALQSLIAINENAYESAAKVGAQRAGSELWLLAGGAVLVAVLVGVGARPRLREFR